MLRARYTEKHGNGDAWAFVPKVRNAAGFDATRTADAIAMSLWPSRGLLIHGFEIKVTRSDWLRELKKPAKAEGIASLVDRWWLVAGDGDVVQNGELPEPWGLLVARGGRLVCAKEAAKLHDEDPVVARRALPPEFGRSFLAALLRSACRVSQATPAAVQEAAEAARAQERVHYDRLLEAANGRAEDLQKVISRFEREAGVMLPLWWGEQERDRVAHALRLVLAGDTNVERAEQRLASLRDQARGLADHIDEVLERNAGEVSEAITW